MLRKRSRNRKFATSHIVQFRWTIPLPYPHSKFQKPRILVHLQSQTSNRICGWYVCRHDKVITVSAFHLLCQFFLRCFCSFVHSFHRPIRAGLLPDNRFFKCFRNVVRWFKCRSMYRGSSISWYFLLPGQFSVCCRIFLRSHYSIYYAIAVQRNSFPFRSLWATTLSK